MKGVRKIQLFDVFLYIHSLSNHAFGISCYSFCSTSQPVTDKFTYEMTERHLVKM